jgi:hypothetical protein
LHSKLCPGQTLSELVQRIIDLRPGNWIRHGDRVRRIIGVKAYRALNSPDDAPPSKSRDGYTFREREVAR